MDISLTFMQIAILFFPGIIVVAILQLFKQRGETYSNLEVFFYSFVYGMIINIIVYSLIFHKDIPLLQFVMGKNIQITELELIIGTIIAVIIGVISSYYRNLGLMHSKEVNYDITYETGYKNALDYIINSPEEMPELLKGRDVKINFFNNCSITVTGKIMLIENQKEYVEILLEKVNDEYTYYQLKKGEFSLEFLASTTNNNPAPNKKYLQDPKRIVHKLMIFLIVALLFWQGVYIYNNYFSKKINQTPVKETRIIYIEKLNIGNSKYN